jgi:hypothetical protein
MKLKKNLRIVLKKTNSNKKKYGSNLTNEQIRG